VTFSDTTTRSFWDHALQRVEVRPVEFVEGSFDRIALGGRRVRLDRRAGNRDDELRSVLSGIGDDDGLPGERRPAPAAVERALDRLAVDTELGEGRVLGEPSAASVIQFISCVLRNERSALACSRTVPARAIASLSIIVPSCGLG